MMNITLTDLLTTYWAQTVLILAALGFFIKRSFDLRAKKIEVKLGLFQQNRHTAIMRFMDEYIGLQKIYRQIISSSFELSKARDEEYIKMLNEKNEQLYSAYYYLKILLDQLEQARYADLIKEMRDIFSEIKGAGALMYPEKKDNDDVRTKLQSFITDTLKKNNDNIKGIGKYFRENSGQSFPIRFK